MLENKNVAVTVTQTKDFIITLTIYFGPDRPSSGDTLYEFHHHIFTYHLMMAYLLRNICAMVNPVFLNNFSVSFKICSFVI
jgi:hypothetical protein